MAGTGQTSIRTYQFYAEGLTPATNNFADGQLIFLDDVDGTPFRSQGIIIKNDNAGGGADIRFSFDGTTLHGRLKPGDMITFDFRRETQVFLASSSASSYRFWAW